MGNDSSNQTQKVQDSYTIHHTTNTLSKEKRMKILEFRKNISQISIQEKKLVKQTEVKYKIFNNIPLKLILSDKQKTVSIIWSKLRDIYCLDMLRQEEINSTQFQNIIKIFKSDFNKEQSETLYKKLLFENEKAYLDFKSLKSYLTNVISMVYDSQISENKSIIEKTLSDDGDWILNNLHGKTTLTHPSKKVKFQLHDEYI